MQLLIKGNSKVGNDTIKRYITLIDSNDGTTSLSVGLGELVMSCSNQFFKFYKDDIKQFQDIDEELLLEAPVRFYVLRNMTPASVFIAEKYDDNTLEIKLDYAIPQYRDFKIGKFVFEDQKEYFSNLGYSKFVVFSAKKEHVNYIKKMGFKESTTEKNSYIKSI